MSCPPRIKICGLRTADAARAAVDAGADAVGLVFVPASPRHADDAAAREVVEAVDSEASIVGVFKDEPIESIRSLTERYSLDEVQLHGAYDAEAIASLAPIHIVQALAFDPTTFAPLLAEWTAMATVHDNLRGLLVDTPDPTRLGGGTGTTFDWSALRQAIDAAGDTPPIILAGGLDAANVRDAIATVRPWGVDVSSGVESSRGVKDVEMIRAFCAAVLGR